MKIKRECKICGKIFEVNPSVIKRDGGKFCSIKCCHNWYIGDRHPSWKGGKIKRICKFCGEEFKIPPSQIKYGRGKFCSQDCHYKWNTKKVKRICKICNKRIEGSRGKFCSWNCYKKWIKIKENNANWKGGKVKMVCKICGKNFAVDPYIIKRGNGKFCCRSCVAIWSAKYSKKQNTSIEIKTENLLKKLKISYQAQKIISEGKTIADFYIPDQRIVIYCDGDYWHSAPKVQQRDATQDLLLGLHGYKVLRLSEKEINNNLRECFKKIQKIKNVGYKNYWSKGSIRASGKSE